MEEQPDVEKIIREIRENARDNNEPVDSTTVAALERDGDLTQLLARANGLFATPQPPPRGLRGLLHKIAIRLLEPEFSEMRHFNELTMRILNKFEKILSGNDTATESDLVAQVRRRIDLLSDLGGRIDHIERLKLEEKIELLEKKVLELEKMGRENS